MALLGSTSCHSGLILTTVAFIISQASGQTDEIDENTGESWTTQGLIDETESATTEEPGIGVNKLIALIVLGSVLGFLLLAVFTCGCWLCRRMRRRAKVKDRVVIEGHYSSKSNNNGSRTKVIAVRENVYREKPQTFWGVQHAVAGAVNSPNPQPFYGSPYGGNGGAYDGQRITYGSPPYGAGPRSPYYP
jgi:hypothetical protein